MLGDREERKRKRTWWVRQARRYALGAGVVLALVALWAVYTLATCGFDGDCWLGERVRMVAESHLSSSYDPSEASSRILIYDFAGVRTLKFGSLSHVRQSSAIIGDTNKFTMPIACHLAAAVLVLAARPPTRILIFGMGGGMLPAFVQQQYQKAHITVVDLENEVVRMALEHFNVKSSSDLEVVISDGRRWLDQLPDGGVPADQRYDLIIQDACAGHPCSLVTVEVRLRLLLLTKPPPHTLSSSEGRTLPSATFLSLPSCPLSRDPFTE